VSARDNGGAAFPDPGRAQSAKQREVLTDTGMTLRDYFAAAALQGFIACHSGMDVCTPDPQQAAGRAYEYADAMLAERAK
jgi:hypothetical protein